MIELKGNVVKTFKIGGATVRIRDDCFPKNDEEREKVLAEYRAAGWAIARRLFEEGKEV